MAITDRLGLAVDPDLFGKAPVRVATTGSNIALAGLQTIDGLALAAGDRVLVKDQTDQTTNGIYNAAIGTWTRSTDADDNSEWVRGLTVFVTDGTVNANSTWRVTTANPITLGTSLITFAQINAVPVVNNTLYFDTLALAQAASIASTATSIQTAGYYAAGDGGGALYKRVASPTANSLNFTSADGAKWQYQLPYVNVRMAGAKGDGSTDDTTAITNAIAHITAVATYGGVLYFPAGNYLSSGGHAISVPTLVLGDGSASFDVLAWVSRVTCTSSTTVLFTVTAKVARFERIALVNNQASPSAGSAIHPNHASYAQQRVDYEAVLVSGFYDNIDVQVGQAWMLHNSIISDPVRYGIRVRNTVNGDAGDWSISGNYFTTATRSGTNAIQVESSGGGKIIGNKINAGAAGNYTYGIVLNDATGGTTQQLIIDGNDIENITQAAIYLQNAWPNIIIDNNILRVGTLPASSYTGGAIVVGQCQNLFVAGGYFESGTAGASAITFPGGSPFTNVVMGLINLNGFVAGAPTAFVNNYNMTDLTAFRPPPQFPMVTMDPRLPGYANVALDNANGCIITYFRVDRQVTVTQVALIIGTSSGNIDVGIYKFNVNLSNWTRVASNGGGACPATGGAAINLSASAILVPGNQYYAAIAADNTTMTFLASTVVPSGNIAVLENPNWQTSKLTSAAYPLPATIAASPAASLKVPLLAVR